MAQQTASEILERRRQQAANEALYQHFMFPRDFHELFRNPQLVAANWIGALIHHQDSLPRSSLTQSRHPFHLGDEFRESLGVVHGHGSFWPHALVLILAFFYHSPWQKTQLRQKDHDFLNGLGGGAGAPPNMRTLMHAWIRGLKPDGTPMTVTPDARHNTTIGFAFNLHQAYLLYWMY